MEYGFIFSRLQSGVSDLHHEQSGVWKKGNPIFHYIKEEYSGIWDLTSHTPLYSNFSTVKIWTESGVSDLHHEQSGVWKKGNPIFHYINQEYQLVG